MRKYFIQLPPDIFLLHEKLTDTLYGDKQALKEKSKAHFHRNSLLSRLGTISVVEGRVGVGEELVLGVLVEHQHLAC